GQPLEGVLGRQKADLHNRQRTGQLHAAGQLQGDFIPREACGFDLGRRVNAAAGLADAGQAVRLADGRGLATHEVNEAVTGQRHHGRVQGRVAATHDDDAAALVVADLGHLVVDVFGVEFVQDGQAPGVVEEPAGDDRLAAQVASPGCDDPL